MNVHISLPKTKRLVRKNNREKTAPKEPFIWSEQPTFYVRKCNTCNGINVSYALEGGAICHDCEQLVDVTHMLREDYEKEYRERENGAKPTTK